jgi:hypothetical protein
LSARISIMRSSAFRSLRRLLYLSLAFIVSRYHARIWGHIPKSGGGWKSYSPNSSDIWKTRLAELFGFHDGITGQRMKSEKTRHE